MKFSVKNFITFDSVSDLLTELIFLFLIVFSPLIYAGVTILPLSVIEISSFFLLALFAVKMLFGQPRAALIKIPLISLSLFIILALFQLLPLPGNLLSLLSPQTSKLYTDFGFNSMGKSTLSIYPEAGVSMLLQCLSYLALFIVAINYFDHEKKIRRIILIIVFSGLLYSFYGIVRRFTMQGSGFSTFINRNHFSAYIQMVIPLTIGYALTRRSTAVRFIFIFLASAMLLALLLALSRAGIICFALSLLIVLIILRKKHVVKKEAALVVAAVLLLSVLLGIASGFDPMQRLRTLLSPFQVFAGRLTLIKNTLSIIKDFPLWGTGLGTLGEIFQKYKTWQGGETFSFTHNEPLQLIAETGLSGFLLIMLLLAGYFRNTLNLLFKRHNPYVIYLSFGCLIGIISILLHSLFDFVFHIPANAVLFTIILALINRVLHIREAETEIEQKAQIKPAEYLRVSFAFILLLSFLSVSLLIFRRYKAAQIFQGIKETKIEDSGLDPIFKYRRILKDLDRAIILNPLDSSFYNKKADIFSEMAAREDLKDDLLHFEEFYSTQKLLTLAEKFYKKAIQANPCKADYHLRLGWLYGVIGEKELAARELNNTVLLDPQNPKIKAYLDNYGN